MSVESMFPVKAIYQMYRQHRSNKLKTCSDLNNSTATPLRSTAVPSFNARQAACGPCSQHLCPSAHCFSNSVQVRGGLQGLPSLLWPVKLLVLFYFRNPGWLRRDSTHRRKNTEERRMLLVRLNAITCVIVLHTFLTWNRVRSHLT